MIPAAIAARLARLEAEVARLRNGGAPLAGDLVPGERGQALDARPLDIWARVERVSGNAYSFQRVLDDDFEYPDLTGPFGTAGDGTSLVAWEVNGRDDVPAGTKVKLTPNRFGAGYTFEYAAGAGTSFTARLTAADTDGLWKFVRLTLDESGDEDDDGTEVADYCAAPFSFDGTATPAPWAGQRVRMFPSGRAGLFEFLPLSPLEAAGDLHTRNATQDVRLPVGKTDGHALLVDSKEATKLRWGAVTATVDTKAADKTTIDRVNAATMAVDDSGVVTVTAVKQKANHPFTADGIMVTSITEEDPVSSDTSLYLTDTPTVRVATDSMTGIVAFTVAAPVDVQAGDYTLADADRGKLLTFTGTRTLTLPDPVPDFADGWYCDVESRDAVLTITRDVAATIDGATTLTVPAGQGVRLFSDGTQWFTQRGLMRQVSGPNRLWGSGSSFSKAGGPVEEIDLGDRLTMAGKDGTTLTYTPDLTPSGKADTLDVYEPLQPVVDGSNLRFPYYKRTVEFVKNAAGEPIDTVIGKASTVTFDVDRCSISADCGGTVSAYAPPCSPAGGIVVGGVAAVTPTPGGIVLGGPGGEELCGSEAFVPATITSVSGDGASGGSEAGMSPLVVTFTPVLAGGGTAGGCQFTFAWTFAGGSPSTSSAYSPTVTFTTAGDHAVTLVVTDCCGNTTETWTGSVRVGD